jgi:hypothetical protein
MRIPPWRIVLTGVAIVVLLAMGIGFVAASSGFRTQDPAAGQAAASEAPDESEGPGDEDGAHGADRLKALGGIFKGRGGHLGLGRRIVHVTATVEDKDGKLIQLQLDHGTILSIGNGSLTVSEAGGTTVTISTDSSTVVRTGRESGTLGDLKVGDEVFVQSRIDGGMTLAKHVVKVPADTAS